MFNKPSFDKNNIKIEPVMERMSPEELLDQRKYCTLTLQDAIEIRQNVEMRISELEYEIAQIDAALSKRRELALANNNPEDLTAETVENILEKLETCDPKIKNDYVNKLKNVLEAMSKNGESIPPQLKEI